MITSLSYHSLLETYMKFLISNNEIIQYSFFLFLFVFISSTFPQWETQESKVNVFLRDVFFTDSLYGWAVGDSGVIISTSDGGKNWDKIFSLSDSVELKQVQFVNRDIGFAGGNVIRKYPTYEAREALLICTSNGGFNWERCDSSFTPDFLFGNVTFLNPDTGWISINNGGQKSWEDRKGMFLKTTDGGYSW